MAKEIRERAQQLLDLARIKGGAELHELEVELLSQTVERAKQVELMIAPKNPASTAELKQLEAQIKDAARAKNTQTQLFFLMNLFNRTAFKTEIELSGKGFPEGSINRNYLKPRVKISAVINPEDGSHALGVDLRGLTGTSDVTPVPIICDSNHPLYNVAALVLNIDGEKISGQAGYEMGFGGQIHKCPHMNRRKPFDVLVSATSPQVQALMTILHPLFPAK